MKRKITSRIIGPLTQDDRFADWWKSSEIDIPFFDNQKLTITFIDFEPDNDINFIEEADRALSHFLSLKLTDRNKIAPLAYKNCMDFLDAVDFDEEEKEPFTTIKDVTEIWNFIAPTDIYLSRRHRRDHDIYVQISCECDWEVEHGLQLVFKQGKQLTRISDQDGHLTEADAYDKPDAADELLSKFI